MLLNPSPVITTRFLFTEGTLVAEISDFGSSFQFERVWDDACDVGMTLVSHKTGREVVYAVSDEDAREGEVLAWHLTPAKPEERFLPPVTIYND